MERNYRCDVCKEIIGTLEDEDHGISNSIFTTAGIPVGVGSALYCNWICFKCDPARVIAYNIGSRFTTKMPWMMWLTRRVK